jgi:hypothetical protein
VNDDAPFGLRDCGCPWPYPFLFEDERYGSPCPYSWEVLDSDEPCTCCDECRAECARNV